jgi:hypothetical protein
LGTSFDAERKFPQSWLAYQPVGVSLDTAGVVELRSYEDAMQVRNRFRAVWAKSPRSDISSSNVYTSTGPAPGVVDGVESGRTPALEELVRLAQGSPPESIPGASVSEQPENNGQPAVSRAIRIAQTRRRRPGAKLLGAPKNVPFGRFMARSNDSEMGKADQKLSFAPALTVKVLSWARRQTGSGSPSRSSGPVTRKVLLDLGLAGGRLR